jgi:hypothetical protein
MTSRISKLVLAAAIAATLPAAASADDCYRERPASWPAPARPTTPPPHRAREAAARERELQQLRAALRALDAERAAYHARHARQPRKLRRYDAGWTERRAELERRFWQLQRVALR